MSGSGYALTLYSVFYIIFIQEFYYSVLKLFIGLAIAAPNAWKPTVNSAIKIASTPDIAYIHQGRLVRYAKPSNQLCMAIPVTGTAITKPTLTNTRKSFDNVKTKLFTEAPNTLRTPISFVF